MAYAHEPDIGPLSWIHGELDETLNSAAEAIAQAASAEDPQARLQFAQGHLHRAHGALSVVGLDGATQFSELLDHFVSAMAHGDISADTNATALASRACSTLANYLGEVINGAGNQPLRLFSVYRELAQASGRGEVSAAEMFFPDLTCRLPRRHTAPTLDDEAQAQHLRGARAALERGLLGWLRSPEDPAGAQTMRDAAAVFEAHQNSAAAVTLWRVAQAFFEALAHGDIPASGLRIKQICTGLAKEARARKDGDRHIPGRLLRDLLFEIGQAPVRTDTQREVRARWKLDDWWHDPSSAPADIPLGPLLRTLRTDITAAQQEWDNYGAGQASALASFNTHIANIAETSSRLGRPALQRLLQGVARLVKWLDDTPEADVEAASLDVATALLAAELNLEGGIADGELQSQTDAALARFEARIQGRPAPENITVHDASRAHERNARQQVAREIQSNLNHIEQTLDDYFRDHSRHSPLTQLSTPLHQIEGALLLIGGERALPLLREANDTIRRLAGCETPQESELTQLADRLSVLGFYVDALHHGNANLDDFLPPEERHTPEPDADDAFTAEEPVVAPVSDFSPAATPEPEAASAPVAETVDTLTPSTPAPANETPNPELDAELLEIFIEEAHDVLAAITTERSALVPHGAQEPLVTIRRGFHTLKGSGRMVGLSDFGEGAWEVEQTLNRWLQLEWPITGDLGAFIDLAHTRLSAWVSQIENGGSHAFDIADLITVAIRLREDETPAGNAPEPVVAAPQEPSEELPGTPVPDAPEEVEAIEATELETFEEPGDSAVTPDTHVPRFDFSSLPTLELDETFTLDDEEDETALDDESPAPEEIQPAEPPVTSAPPSDNVQLGDTELSRQLFELYVNEGRSHLHTLREGLRPLRNNPAQPSEQLLRAAHTLAGISGTAHIRPLQGLAHSTALAFGRLSKLQQTPNPEQLDLLDATVEHLEAMLADVEHERMPLAVPELEEQLEHLGQPATTEPGPQIIDTVEDVIEPPSRSVAEEDDIEAPIHVNDELDPQLLPIFLEEAEDLVQGLDGHLRAWQSDEGNAEHSRLAARQLHTLKGSARMAGAMRLGELVHRLESHLEDGLADATPPARLIETLTGGLDQIAQIISRLSSGEPEPEAPASASDEAAAETPDAQIASQSGAIAAPEVPGVSQAAATSATLRMRAESLDGFINTAGETGISRTRIEGELRTVRRSLLDLTENVIRLRSQLREVELQAETQMQNRIAQADSQHAEFDPLEMDRYTRLQELTRMMAESVGDVTTVQQNLLRNLDGAELALHGQARITRDLQQALMQVRMVAFDSLADRLYRVVRQSAKDLGKRVNLDIRGGRSELDRGVLEHMTVAIEHMLRNAVAHGIETAEARRDAGKDEIGQITITVSQISNEIAIDLADDGSGLDLSVIRNHAIARGLLREDEEADERTLTNMIFAPGFSTADEISTIAGRGVGMDVVRAEATALGGRIDVDSRHGEGTRFRIYLPLTLAITQALIVRAGHAGYALPSTMIAQALELRTDALERLRTEGHTEWNGERYAYRYLPELLGDHATRPEIQRFNWVLLLRAGSERLALHVDQLRGNQEIVVKSAGPQLLRVVGVSGATVLGDGEIVLILNPLALTSRLPAAPLQTADAPNLPDTASGNAADTRRSVLVVDDSLTVRKITSRMLEREGYRVAIAKDGADALEQVQEDLPDIILSDIEMPRMDGFDFVRNLRANERTREIPVIMITSRLADKHREYARKLGANEYLGKPYDEDELLALMRQHTRDGVAQ